MQILVHQTQHAIGDFKQIFGDLKQIILEHAADTCPQIHVFPELYLAGYPLQDLCFERQFHLAYQSAFTQFQSWLKTVKTAAPQVYFVGGLDYEWEQMPTGPQTTYIHAPQRIYNVVFAWEPGQPLQKVYTKQLLPNYDIYDEKKYFTPGNQSTIYTFQSHKIGLLICEDMWASDQYDRDPVIELKKAAAATGLDMVINLSASPFHLNKLQKRLEKAKEISCYLDTPFYYVNRVGGEDEILFDGASFGVYRDELLFQCAEFKPEHCKHDIPPANALNKAQAGKVTPGKTWNDLFRPELDLKKSPPELIPLSEANCDLALRAIQFGLQEYAHKCGFKRFLVALSGGIDSALVLTIAKLSLRPGQTLEALYMPSMYSASISYELSRELCQNLQVPLQVLPIKFFHSTIRLAFQDQLGSPLEGLSDENIQSRLRGTLVYARSNQTNAMVLNTSNKSEIAVGYSTQYGDSVGALSLLGDLYKTEVFQLSEFINQTQNLIPAGIIQRPPSAELRADQRDDQSLPAYKHLDAILEGLLSFRMGVTDLCQLGFNPQAVEKVYRLYRLAEYKRKQFAPILKLKAKSFGFGYRLPICKSFY